MKGRVLGLGAVCTATAFGLDQATKAMAVIFASDLAAGIELLPVLNLIFLRNAGVSFGLFGSVPWWALTILAVAIVAVLIGWLATAQSRLVAAALGLTIGGALGNVLDRVRHGAVTDFLDFHVASYHWPAFNLADAAVVGGVALLLADGLRASERPRKISALPLIRHHGYGQKFDSGKGTANPK